MRNKVIASLLLLASCAFAQYGNEYNSGAGFDSGSNYNSDAGYVSGTNYNPQTEYTTQATYNSTTEYSAPKYDKKDLYTHAHRGFYFSTSLTFAYMNDTHTETERNYKEKEEAYGYLHPYGEIRLGGSIANVASIFGVLGVGTGSGSYERNDEEYDKYKVDATLLKLLFGVGGEFYPIQDKESPAYGIFLGLTIGVGIDGAFYDKYYDTNYGEYHYSGDDGFINYMFRFEIGKDWWFSRRWSVGIAFNYTYGTYTDNSSDYYYKEKDEYSSNTFGFTIRLTH